MIMRCLGLCHSIYINTFKDEDGRTDTDCEDDGGLLDDFWDLFTGKVR